MQLTSDMRSQINEIAEIAHYMWLKGWAEQNAGNISVDVTRMIPPRAAPKAARREPGAPAQTSMAGRCLLVTVAGSRMRDIKKAPSSNLMLIRISKDGRRFSVLWGGAGPAARPTSELPSHLAVHAMMRRRGMEQAAVLHTHPPHLIALSHVRKFAAHEKKLNALLFSVHPEIAISIPEGVGMVPYRCPGSKALSSRTRTAFIKHRVVIWEKHGCAAIGADARQAFDLVDLVEKASAIYLLCRASGNRFQGLTPGQVRQLEKRFGLS